MAKAIVITGPESTGKTTLAKDLAAHFSTIWVPEYARTYVETLNRPYTYADVEIIAKTQIKEFEKAVYSQQKYVFFDTFLIITHVWFLHVYKHEPKWIESAIKNCNVDLYLLCKPNITWEYDPVRENPTNRDFLYDWYKRELIRYGKKFIEIDQIGKKRSQQAIESVKKI